MKPETFYAKLMLFGEYSVIFDSMGLTVPYAHFTGELSFINNEQYTEYESALESNQQLRQYLPYLRKLRSDNFEMVPIDLEALENDIQHGLYFESNIPQGYGIGSSGAMVAAIFDRYALSKLKLKKIYTGQEIATLKAIFSGMESFFHGKSSGIDPLLCYIRQPLLIRNKNEIVTVGIPGDKFGTNHAIFLIDSGIVGQTGPLVSYFLQKCKDKKYLSLVTETLVPTNNSCINTLLKGDMVNFFTHLSALSSFQFDYLPEMIPEKMKKYWAAGLERDDFKMKLCGSGGGGFLLGISRDFKSTRKYFQHNSLKLIPVYKND